MIVSASPPSGARQRALTLPLVADTSPKRCIARALSSTALRCSVQLLSAPNGARLSSVVVTEPRIARRRREMLGASHPTCSAETRASASSAIDGRTTRHGGYALSQRLRKGVEEAPLLNVRPRG